MRNAFRLKGMLWIGTIFLVFVALLFLNQAPSVLGFPMYQVGLDTPQAQEIEETLRHAHIVLGSITDEASLDLFDAILVNHPLFAQALSVQERTRLRTNITRFLGPDAEFGYLNAMKTKRMLQFNGVKLLEEAEAQARKRNTELTQQDWARLTEQNYGYTPAYANAEASNRPSLEFFSIRLGAGTARVEYTQGISNLTAILVQIDGRWMVAGIR